MKARCWCLEKQSFKLGAKVGLISTVLLDLFCLFVVYFFTKKSSSFKRFEATPLSLESLASYNMSNGGVPPSMICSWWELSKVRLKLKTKSQELCILDLPLFLFFFRFSLSPFSLFGFCFCAEWDSGWDIKYVCEWESENLLNRVCT